MAVLTLHAAGGADPAQAWERYADPSRWAQWAPQISRVSTDASRIAGGVTGRVYGPLGVHVDFVVEDVDEEARRWVWRVRFGPLRLHLEHRVTGHPRGAATSLRLDGPLPVLLGYAPLARLALGRLVAADR